MSKPIGYICENCGSPDIVFDAHAEWDHVNQRMELLTTYDHNSCASCGEENSAHLTQTYDCCTAHNRQAARYGLNRNGGE